MTAVNSQVSKTNLLNSDLDPNIIASKMQTLSVLDKNSMSSTPEQKEKRSGGAKKMEDKRDFKANEIKYCLIGRPKKVITNCKHTSALHYAKGMCNHCYHKYGRKNAGLATGCAHTDKPNYCKQLCINCYINTYNKCKKKPREANKKAKSKAKN